MIYEAKSPRYRLATQGKAVQCRPAPEIQANGEKLGYFDTTSSEVLLGGFKDREECETFLANSTACKAGKIWPRTARLEKVAKLDKGAARNSVVADMTEAQLRGIITGSNVAIPGEGTDIAKLREIAGGCLAGNIKPGTVIEPELTEAETGLPAETEEAVDEPKRKKKK